MSKPKTSIFSIISILTGSLIFYFHGYKDNRILEVVSYIFIFVGWLTLYVTLFGHIVFDDKKKLSKKNRTNGVTRSIIQFVCNLIFGGVVVGNMVLISDLKDKRVAFILRTQSTHTTVATVTKAEDRYSKVGSKHYAIINYETNDKIISQAIYDYKRKYTIGQKIKIKYSEEYPAMFEVAEDSSGQ